MPIFSSSHYCGFGTLEENSVRSFGASIDRIELIPGKYYINIVLYNHSNGETINALLNAITFFVVQGTHGQSPLNCKLRWNEIQNES
jgi:hypothetical protein